MPTQRLEEKRVEEHVGERERARMHAGEEERERERGRNSAYFEPLCPQPSTLLWYVSQLRSLPGGFPSQFSTLQGRKKTLINLLVSFLIGSEI